MSHGHRESKRLTLVGKIWKCANKQLWALDPQDMLHLGPLPMSTRVASRTLMSIPAETLWWLNLVLMSNCEVHSLLTDFLRHALHVHFCRLCLRKLPTLESSVKQRVTSMRPTAFTTSFCCFKPTQISMEGATSPEVTEKKIFARNRKGFIKHILSLNV